MRLEIPKPRGRSKAERMIRAIALVGVIAVVAWAFMQNNKSVLERIQTRQAVNDQTETLSQTDLDFLKGFIASMRETYGVNMKVTIYKGQALVPEVGPKTMFFGLAPEAGEVILRFPPLVRAALGDDFTASLTDDFMQSFKQGDWPRELKIVLTMIWSRLSALDSQQGNS